AIVAIRQILDVATDAREGIAGIGEEGIAAAEMLIDETAGPGRVAQQRRAGLQPMRGQRRDEIQRQAPLASAPQLHDREEARVTRPLELLPGPRRQREGRVAALQVLVVDVALDGRGEFREIVEDLVRDPAGAEPREQDLLRPAVDELVIDADERRRLDERG